MLRDSSITIHQRNCWIVDFRDGYHGTIGKFDRRGFFGSHSIDPEFKMIMMCKSWRLILFLMTIGPIVWAQTAPDALNNNTFDEKYRNIYKWYVQEQGKALQIFNGPEYIPVDINIKGHPFFELKAFQSGLIKYNGEIYIEIEMGYDIYRDELAVVHYDENGNFSMIRPHSENVDGFSFNGHQFIRLTKERFPQLVSTGFYELLYDGSLKVFVQHVKKVRPSNDGPYRYQFVDNSVIYVFKDHEFHTIGSKKALLKLLEVEKGSIRKIGRIESFKDYTVSVCKRYDELKQEGSQ